jgi:L-ascorbate metabolism protein UlaG (beta-lactamase superfamily)
VFEAGGESVLVYPMLRRADAAEPVANMPNGRHNPLVDLLLGYEEITSLLQKIDTVLVTHPHTDYWDLGTEDLTTRDSPIPCQPEATEKIAAASFPWIVPVDPEVKWGRLLLRRTSGRHGTGEIGRRMAPVSGFVVSSDGAPRPSTYGAGDTIWCPEVEEALAVHRPGVVVLNACAAQFLEGDPITMTVDDVIQTAGAVPEARITAVHMEAINHCLLTRDKLKDALDREGLAKRVDLPADGETLSVP